MERALTGNPYIHPSDAPDGVGGTLRFSVATGAASGVDIDVADHAGKEIAPDDVVSAVIEHDTGVLTDRTSDLMAIKAGAIQLSGASTAGNQLHVTWLDRLPE